MAPAPLPSGVVRCNKPTLVCSARRVGSHLHCQREGAYTVAGVHGAWCLQHATMKAADAGKGGRASRRSGSSGHRAHVPRTFHRAALNQTRDLGESVAELVSAARQAAAREQRQNPALWRAITALDQARTALAVASAAFLEGAE